MTYKAILTANVGRRAGKGVHGTEYAMELELDLPFVPVPGLWIRFPVKPEEDIYEYHVGPVAWNLTENRFEIIPDLNCKLFRCVTDSQAKVEEIREWMEQLGFKVTDRMED